MIIHHIWVVTVPEGAQEAHFASCMSARTALDFSMRRTKSAPRIETSSHRSEAHETTLVGAERREARTEGESGTVEVREGRRPSPWIARRGPR